MSAAVSVEVTAMLRVAGFIARFQQARAIGPEHLLLAIMSDTRSQWAKLIEERGVGTYTTVARAVGKLPPLETVDRFRRPPRYVRSMRRVIVDLLVGLLILIFRGLRGRPPRPEPQLPLREDAMNAMDIAHKLADGSPTVGHLLIAVASIPGKQIKLLRREHRLIAAAARQELGLARPRDQLLLLVDRPALACRRLEGRLRSGRALARGG